MSKMQRQGGKEHSNSVKPEEQAESIHVDSP